VITILYRHMLDGFHLAKF